MNTNPAETQVISVPDGSIRDYVDGEFRKDTPEEYVRQTIEKRLINEHKYKREQIKIEFGLKLGSGRRRPRADIVVFRKDSPEMTQDQVWLIVECKKESIGPKNKKDGIDQLKSYMSICPNCEWGMWTNGKYKEVLRSDDVIRIKTPEYSGYVYAYLKSKAGRLLIETNNYGAVIEHIEPEHLNHIPIPNPSAILKQEIHDLIETSFKLQDESNELMDMAQVLLKTALRLPSIEVLQEQAEQIDKMVSVLNYSISSSEVIDRLDGSYYVPVVKAIEQHIAKTAREVVKVDNSQISRSVTVPGRFKRIYVEEGNGTVFFTGKYISELDPTEKKYLSLSQHTEKIKDELTIKEGMILITRSGTLGKTTFVPKHWDGWAITDDIICLVPTTNEISGYLYAWLSSDYARELIHRFAYGAVVRHLEKEHISQVSVPLLNNENAQREINDTVLEANQKRMEAYHLEQKALRVLDEKVIYAG